MCAIAKRTRARQPAGSPPTRPGTMFSSSVPMLTASWSAISEWGLQGVEAVHGQTPQAAAAQARQETLGLYLAPSGFPLRRSW